MALYVYSIVAAEHPCRLEGLKGIGAEPGPLRTVAAAGLRAVVSDVHEAVRPARRDLTAHQAVQERLMADGTVLPLRFGYTAPDEATVTAALEEGAAAYGAALDRLQGCAEFHVKASRDEESLLREILTDSAQARLLNERIRAGDTDPRLPLQLGELVAAEVHGRQEALAADLVRELVPFARAHAAHPPVEDGKALAVSLSLLVADDRQEQFRKAGAELTERAGDTDVRVTGPLPPYSFV
ncbi:GvpL/GvpF family gas vesicle protein [Streptomyces sp. NRRL S-87]|uniref:GvpL/GvpF family gas vesicle protein n=1 Tax=Streptomyces sp. NRRL S-87 TaxID=1463920 RepID=UPI0004BE5E92|nr:GvpL/GvpF family gas vesicle protein [Streptomyces sp. NRRL S-87]